MTDNKSLEELEKIHNLIHQPRWSTVFPEDAGEEGYLVEKRIIDHFEMETYKMLRKISFHFGIPVEDLQKALAAKDEPLANKEIKDDTSTK